eukprot:4774367-Pyramimonas_sp.AAC.1
MLSKSPSLKVHNGMRGEPIPRCEYVLHGSLLARHGGLNPCWDPLGALSGHVGILLWPPRAHGDSHGHRRLGALLGLGPIWEAFRAVVAAAGSEKSEFP